MIENPQNMKLVVNLKLQHLKQYLKFNLIEFYIRRNQSYLDVPAEINPHLYALPSYSILILILNRLVIVTN